MRYIIKTLHCGAFDVECDENILIEDLKKLIEPVIRVPADNLRLIFAGKGLINGTRLNVYNCQDGSTIHCVARLQCNCYHFEVCKFNDDHLPIQENWEKKFSEVFGSISSVGNDFERIKKEIKSCYKRKHPNVISLLPRNPKSHKKWELTIRGPKGSLYENGVFKITAECSPNREYPRYPMQFKFETKMFHPMYQNHEVDKEAECLNTSEEFKKFDKSVLICNIISTNQWNDDFTLKDVIESLCQELVNVEKNYRFNKPMFPCDRNIPMMLLEKGEIGKFKRKAKEWTKRFADPFGWVKFFDDEETERILYSSNNINLFRIENLFSISKVYLLL